jgi:hypothetical protein
MAKPWQNSPQIPDVVTRLSLVGLNSTGGTSVLSRLSAQESSPEAKTPRFISGFHWASATIEGELHRPDQHVSTISATEPEFDRKLFGDEAPPLTVLNRMIEYRFQKAPSKSFPT